MNIDRTWTISFENSERNLLLQELEMVEAPKELGWKSMLMQVATAQQTTLSFRAIERLSLELNITRNRFTKHVAHQNYNERFPQINALSSGIELILFSYKQRSA